MTVLVSVADASALNPLLLQAVRTVGEGRNRTWNPNRSDCNPLNYKAILRLSLLGFKHFLRPLVHCSPIARSLPLHRSSGEDLGEDLGETLGWPKWKPRGFCPLPRRSAKIKCLPNLSPPSGCPISVCWKMGGGERRTKYTEERFRRSPLFSYKIPQSRAAAAQSVISCASEDDAAENDSGCGMEGASIPRAPLKLREMVELTRRAGGFKQDLSVFG